MKYMSFEAKSMNVSESKTICYAKDCLLCLPSFTTVRWDCVVGQIGLCGHGLISLDSETKTRTKHDRTDNFPYVYAIQNTS
jgi:hypothetical protein